MSTPARIAKLSGVYETLGQLIKNPKSLGLREQLPPRVLGVLTSTREILREEMNQGTPIAGDENDLVAELSQDADLQRDIPEGELNGLSFNRLLSHRMEQHHLSNYDVAVSLGCSIQHVSDLIAGVREPTELHVAELALLFGVTRESLATAAKPKIDRLAATV